MFVKSFFSQRFNKLTANITSKNVSQVRTKQFNTRSFVCNVNLHFLRSSRHFNDDTTVAVIVSFLNVFMSSTKSVTQG